MRNLDASPAMPPPPPCEPPWPFKYIFSAISPACLMTSSFWVPDATPFLDERSSKSCAVLAPTWS